MATTEQGEEADTGTSEVRSEGNHCHGGSNSAMLPTTEPNDGQTIISSPEEVPSQTVEDHAEVSSTVDPASIPTVRRSRRLQGQAAEGHSKQHWSLRTEGVDCDHPCYESLEYNYITSSLTWVAVLETPRQLP